MFIRIDPDRDRPIFSQIMEGIRLAVASGRLYPGDRIPSIRDLAVELRVNPNTVVKAYQELERSGLVEVKRGMGYFVTSSLNGEVSVRERRSLLEDRVEELLSYAIDLGFAPEEVREVLEERANRVPPERAPG